jgi:DNA-binding transcriptional MerR regulator
LNQACTTAEVCEKFDIHRNTLFRWEKEGLIPEPARSLRGERQYTSEQLQAVARIIQTSRHGRLYAHIVKGNNADDLQRLRELDEENALFKFVYLHERTGLAELREFSSLRPSTIRQLLEYALDHSDPLDDLFWEILSVISGSQTICEQGPSGEGLHANLST